MRKKAPEEIKFGPKQFKDQFIKTTILLANIAECFREIEMVFMTHTSKPDYLEKWCAEFDDPYTVFHSPPSQLPETALRLSFQFKPGQNKWAQESKEEKITKKIFDTHFKKLMELNTSYHKKHPDFLHAYWQRQKEYYQQEQKESVAEKVKKPKLEESEAVRRLKANLIKEFESYRELMCLSPEAMTELVHQKLALNLKFTPELCLEFIMSLFVGRDISYCPKTDIRELLPKVFEYINNFVQICDDLHQAVHKKPLVKKEPTPLLRSNSMPTIFQTPKPTSNIMSMQLTPEEAKLIAELRQKKLAQLTKT